jgi:hypothetical protein
VSRTFSAAGATRRIVGINPERGEKILLLRFDRGKHKPATGGAAKNSILLA